FRLSRQAFCSGSFGTSSYPASLAFPIAPWSFLLYLSKPKRGLGKVGKDHKELFGHLFLWKEGLARS
ncbi:hypothetical protein A7K72_06715, partial [Candidatus Methylacidiphilum fumarolicum]